MIGGRSARLTQIHISDLFGHGTLSIPLDRDRPTVITGSNGTGKSTILRLVNAVAQGDFRTIANAPIRQMRLEFDAIPSFELTTADDGSKFVSWGEHSMSMDFDIVNLPDWASEHVAEHGYDVQASLESLSPVGPFRKVPYNEFRRVRLQLAAMQKRSAAPAEFEWYGSFRSKFQVIFITDQRLVVEAKDYDEPNSGAWHPRSVAETDSVQSFTKAVRAASADIANRMATADSEYARISQAIDKRLPMELIAVIAKRKDVPKRHVLGLQSRIQERQEGLRQVGLLDAGGQYQPSLTTEELNDANVRAVIAAVLESTQEKLRSLDQIATRLEAFRSFLDQRYQSKSIHLSRNAGIEVSVGASGKLRPDQLSSGEQQMLVLAYEILFTPEVGTLVIIDEPEISLHVGWQLRLIRDLEELGRPSDLQFLMATHSPVIVSDDPGLERSLDDLLES